ESGANGRPGLSPAVIGSGVGAVVEVGGEGGVAPSPDFPVQRRVGRLQGVAVQLGAGVIEARDAALDVARLGRVALGLDVQISDDVDTLARRDVLEGYAGRPDGADLADGRPVQPGDRTAGAAEEDVGQRGPLLVAGVLVDVEHYLPAGAGLHPVEVADRHHGPPGGEVDAIGVTLVDVPRQGAETLTEA